MCKLLACFTLAITATILANVEAANSKPVFCYWGTWAHYRGGKGNFKVSNINPHLCTHIAYSFFGITDAGAIKSLDSWLDNDLNNIGQLVALKQQNSRLKVLAAVGGWNEDSAKYSGMAADAGKRSTFVNSVVQFLQTHGFDGLDMDWEYPAQRGGSAADRVNFVTLLRELKTALSARNLLLTVAVAAGPKSASISYDIAGVAQQVDLINVMTYDLAGSWDSTVGYNAPLMGPGDNTVKAAIDYWMQQGAPAHKIMLGIPFYGRTFTLVDSSNHILGALSSGAGAPGPYTLEQGFLGYNEICEQRSTWTSQWDATHLVPYAYRGNQWLSYDDPQSIAKKMKFISDYNLAGAMVWSMETDDFSGICGPAYPLLSAINAGTGTTGPTSAPPTAPNTSSTSTSTARPTSPSGGPFRCPADGNYVNPSDCNRFYTCVGGTAHAFQCPAGLYFDQVNNGCNWANLVECNATG